MDGSEVSLKSLVFCGLSGAQKASVALRGRRDNRCAPHLDRLMDAVFDASKTIHSNDARPRIIKLTR